MIQPVWKTSGSFFKKKNKHTKAENEDKNLYIDVYSALFRTVQTGNNIKLWYLDTIELFIYGTI